ncbi:MAG: BCD family MFS transporter [Pseudomonadota bacterium]
MALWTLRIALPKVAVGWMFALLTIDFNRVAIVEFGIAAIIVSSLLSIHYFLAPFQVVTGRIADCHPVMGYRRSPYLLGASALASLLFLALPTVTISMGGGSTGAMIAGVALFVMFGLCMAVIADSYHSLIAEITEKQYRPTVIAVVWVVMILSTIFSAIVMNAVQPEFSPETMQRLYNLTPPIVILSVVIGLVGVERRMNAEEIQTAINKARSLAPAGNPLASAARLISANSETRRFFIFISLAIFAIFLQENLIEVFGAEVFGMQVSETRKLQPVWGGGILLGMVLMGTISAGFSVPKHISTLIGCTGAGIGFVLLGYVGFFELENLLLPTLFYLGFCAGIFNVGALALMMDMTVEGATGMYMGLWGVAQAAGMGLSAVVAGTLHTSLIASGLMKAEVAYWAIFGLESVLLIVAAALLFGLKPDVFQAQAKSIRRNRSDTDDAMTGTLGVTSA